MKLMAEQNTYIKLHRSILDWGWYTDINTFKLFIHLLLKANIVDVDWQGMTIHRGEVITSIGSLSKQTGLSQKQIRVALNHLIRTNEVAKTTSPKFTIISIRNYDKFQKGAKSGANKGQGEGKVRANKGQQYKNNKEYIKKEKEYIRQKPLNAALPEDWLTAPLTEEQVAGLTPEQMIARRDMARE